MAYHQLKLKYLKQMYPILRFLHCDEVVELGVEAGTLEFLKDFKHHWAACDKEGMRSGEFVACGLPTWVLPAFHFKNFPWPDSRKEVSITSLLDLLVANTKSPEYIVHYRYDENHKLHVMVYDYRDLDWRLVHLEAHEEVAETLGATFAASLERMSLKLAEVQGLLVGRVGRTTEEKAGQQRLPF